MIAINRPLAVATVLALALAACGDEPASPPGKAAAAEAQPAVAEPPVDMTEKELETTIPVGGPKLVTSVRIASGAETDLETLRAGAPLTARLQTLPLPAGYVGRLLIRRGDTTIEAQKPAAENGRALEVTIERTAELEPGEWTVEVWLGGEKVHERTIAVVRAR